MYTNDNWHKQIERTWLNTYVQNKTSHNVDCLIGKSELLCFPKIFASWTDQHTSWLRSTL